MYWDVYFPIVMNSQKPDITKVFAERQYLKTMGMKR